MDKDKMPPTGPNQIAAYDEGDTYWIRCETGPKLQEQLDRIERKLDHIFAHLIV